MDNTSDHKKLFKLKKHLPALALRSGLIQGFFTPGRMQGIGFGWALLPFIKATSENREEMSEKMIRHFGRFNGNPYFASVALGAVARMEAEGDKDNVASMKQMITVSSGAVGDRIFWQHLKPLLLLLAVVAILLLPAKKTIIISVLLSMLFVYGFITWWVRFRGVYWGWDRGKAAPVFLVRWPVQRLVTPLAWIGSFFSGILLTYAFFGQFNTSIKTTDFPINPAAVLLILVLLAFRKRLPPVVQFFIALLLGLISSVSELV